MTRWLFISFLLLSSTTAEAALPSFLLKPSIKRMSLSSEQISHHIDYTGKLGIDELRNNPSLLTKIPGNTIFEFNTHPIWLAFELEKSKEDSYRNYLIEIGNPHIASYELYVIADDGAEFSVIQGDNYPFQQREVRHNFFVHNLPAMNDSKLQIYFRVDQEGQEIHFPIRLYQRDYFVQDTLKIKMLHGLIIGLFLITTLVTFALFFVNHNKFFIYEVVVSLSSIFYILAEEGYGMMMFWPNHPSFNGTSRPISISIILIFSLLFTLDFVRLRTYKKLIINISYWSIGLYCIWILFFHPLDICHIRTLDNIGDIITVFLFSSFVICILIVSISLWSWIKEGSTNGMVVFFVFLATLFSIFIRIMAIQGFGHSSVWVQHTGFITRAIHVPLIGGYLIYNAIKLYRQSLNDKISLLEEKSTSSQVFIEGLDAERQRVSMALHDSAGSIITGLKANLQMLSNNNNHLPDDTHYKETLNLSDRLQQEIRNISNDLLPSAILTLGLPSEINRILTSIEDTYDINTYFESNQSSKMELGDKVIFHLYYIIREALDNIVKYANAKNILVQLMKYDDEIHLLIEDDGVGFEVEEENLIGGVGLKNMALRIGWLNGTIDIYSLDGTSISINIPL